MAAPPPATTAAPSRPTPISPRAAATATTSRGAYGGSSTPNTGTATCSGKVSVKFTWIPSCTGDNLPPSAAILSEYCTSQWTVSKNSDVTYTPLV